MQIKQIDVIGVQAFKAGVHRLNDIEPRRAMVVGPLATGVRVDEFGRQHPLLTPCAYQAPYHFFRNPAVVAICGINEVNTLIKRLVGDTLGHFFAGLSTEHHGTQGQWRHFNAVAT